MTPEKKVSAGKFFEGFSPTTLDKMFGKNYINQAKPDKRRKLCLCLCNFLPLFPK